MNEKKQEDLTKLDYAAGMLCGWAVVILFAEVICKNSNIIRSRGIGGSIVRAGTILIGCGLDLKVYDYSVEYFHKVKERCKEEIRDLIS